MKKKVAVVKKVVAKKAAVQEPSVSETASTRNFQEVALSRIRPAAANPRKSFKNMEQMIESVRTIGVIQPILIRPMSDELYEIVAGERRYRAALAVAEENGAADHYQIPAMVKEMTDDEAFEFMTVENLQREDLTELEEARNFQVYLDRRGEDGVHDLAARLGISAQYVRRRTMVLKLPEEILSSWEEGKLRYGHLEQFCRVRPEDLEKFIKQLKGYNGEIITVSDLKRRIDDDAPLLKTAFFDRKEIGCHQCRYNTTVQRSLFGDDLTDKKGQCINPNCFKQHQNNWLLANWEKFKQERNLATNGFRFDGSVNYDEYKSIWQEPKNACMACDKFVSFLAVSGGMNMGDQRCLDPGCHTKTYSAKPEKTEAEKDSNAPHCAWHGEFFREIFYKTAIPEHYEQTDPVMRFRLLLFMLLAGNQYQADIRFGEKYDPEGVATSQYGSYRSYSHVRAWEFLMTQDSQALDAMLKDVTLGIIMDCCFQKFGTINPGSRHSIAKSLGVDLQKEWLMTEEYLQKKTVSEIHAIAKKFGLFDHEKAVSYLTDKLGKKSGRFDACKKSELVKLILESGIDLAGIVPDEIIGKA